jgi:hypothetical protein
MTYYKTHYMYSGEHQGNTIITLLTVVDLNNILIL